MRHSIADYQSACTSQSNRNERQALQRAWQFLWYMSRSNALEPIQYYLSGYEENSDDGKTVHGGYGPRLFGAGGDDQVQNVIDLLKRKPSSRRAVIQLFSASDLREDYKDIPCTCTLQFFIRKTRLDLLVYMRSNDVFLGFPHDVFAFTMLQELMARSLSVRLGTYRHAVGSLHLYEADRRRAEQYLAEGWQSNIVMPHMPLGDQWGELSTVLDAESRIRSGEEFNWPETPYWKDIVRLLRVFRFQKPEFADPGAIEVIKKEMMSPVYAMYIEQKEGRARKAEKEAQMRLL